MADTKISALVEAAELKAGDWLPIADMSVGLTRKVDVADLMPHTVINMMHRSGVDNTATSYSTSAFQAALDEIAASANGGTILVPAGRYKLAGLSYSGTVPLIIKGTAAAQVGTTTQGTSLQLGTAGNLIHLSNAASRGVRIQDLALYGSALASSCGILIDNRNYIYVDNVTASNFSGSGSAGFRIDGITNGPAITNTFNHCKIRTCERGLDCINAIATNVIGGYWAEGTYGIKTDSGGDTLCVMGVMFDSFSSYAIDADVTGCRFISNRLEGNGNGIRTNGNFSSTMGNFFLGAGSGTGLLIDTGSLHAVAIGNNYSNWGTYYTDNGVQSHVLDFWEASYDWANELLTISDDVRMRALQLDGQIRMNRISTKYFTGGPTTYNDWNPHRGSLLAIQLQDTAAYTITGIDSNTATEEGRLIHVYVFGTAGTVILKHSSASSASANRIYCPADRDMTLKPNDCVTLQYEKNNNKWRVIAGNTVTSANATGGSGSGGSGNQYVAVNIGGVTYKLLHDGTL